MQGLFLEYNDPLFGLIILFSTIFIITLITYIWNLLASSNANRHIINFVNQFNSSGKPQTLKLLLQNKEVPANALELLASNYFKAGQYEEAIEICIDLLKRNSALKKRKIYLYILGRSYFKAGFYKRAESTFVELLRSSINEPDALKYLIVLYERLHRFDDALGVLEPLDEMGLQTHKERAYLQMMRLLFNAKNTKEEKLQGLVKLYLQEPLLIRPAFINLFRLDAKFAWENLPKEGLIKIIDILWYQPKEQLNLDIISTNEFLKALYYAQGTSEMSGKSTVFELELLGILQKSGHTMASLQIEYLCEECKEITPLMNNRCPHCMALLTLEPQLSITKTGGHESYYSF